jgi:flagellum-specific peptidoglycan hydrolase FlgJ
MKRILLTTFCFLFALTASAQKNTSNSYIDKFKDNAIRIMHQSGVPASIVLAVAMHESGNGNSKVAQNLNNHFGVKGRKTVVYSVRNKKVRSSYKQYDSPFDSFQDFARIMTERKQFSHLATKLSHYDYKAWVRGIQRSGYASSKTWGAQVLAIINRYDLNEYDEKPDSTSKAKLASKND